MVFSRKFSVLGLLLSLACAGEAYEAGDLGGDPRAAGGTLTQDGDSACVSGDVCKFPTDCCGGQRCIDGMCQIWSPPQNPNDSIGTPGDAGGPGPGDDPGEAGPPAECSFVDPDLSGAWSFDANLFLDQAIGGFFEGFLNVADELKDYLCPISPLWACQLLGTISDLKDILGLMYVQQDIYLYSSGDQTYTGTETWSNIAFMLGGTWVVGDPSDVYYWQVEADNFTAYTCNGFLYIQDHKVSMNFCNFVQWLLDTSMWFATGGEYTTLNQVVTSLCYNIDPVLGFACNALADDLLDELVGCGGIGIVNFEYHGVAQILNPGYLSSGGYWGELNLGDDFTGSFYGTKY